MSQSQNSRAFDLAFAEDGGTWPSNGGDPGQVLSLLEQNARLVDHLLDANRRLFSEHVADHPTSRTLPRISLDFIDSNEFNGFATRMGNGFACGLTAPLGLGIMELVAHVFAARNVFHNIGDAQKGAVLRLDGRLERPMFQLVTGSFGLEVNQELGLSTAAEQRFEHNIALLRKMAAYSHADANAQKLKPSAYFQNYDFFLKYCLPICPVRREAVVYFSQTMLLILWLHEISHVLFGHVDYVAGRARSSSVRLFEIPPFPEAMGFFRKREAGISDLQVRHFFELEADLYATAYVVGMIVDDNEVMESSLDRFDKLVGVFVFLFMTFTTLASKFDEDTPSSTHPRFGTRLYHLILSLQIHCRKLPDVLEAMSIAARLVDAFGAERGFRNYISVSRVFDPSSIHELSEERARLLEVGEGLGAQGLAPYGNLNVLVQGFLDAGQPDASEQPAKRVGLFARVFGRTKA